MSPSNAALLSRSHAVYKAKKRAKQQQVPEILFDDDARRDYLTGFHKRNLIRKEAAKNKAKERDRQEKLQSRREQRQARQEAAEENARAVEQAYRQISVHDHESDETEFTGFSAPDKGKARQDAAYEDEEQLAVVTVVDEFDPRALMHGQLQTEVSSRSPSPDARRRPDGATTRKVVSQPATAKTPRGSKKKFTYETKAARKAQRTKQRARRTEKAERAGGKAQRSARAKRR